MGGWEVDRSGGRTRWRGISSRPCRQTHGRLSSKRARSCLAEFEYCFDRRAKLPETPERMAYVAPCALPEPYQVIILARVGCAIELPTFAMKSGGR